MASEQLPPWASLPEPMVAHIMSFLPLRERCKMSTVCKSWNSCLGAPILWKFFNCGFFFPRHQVLLQFVKQYGHFVTHLTINLNQTGKENRENAISAIEHFSDIDNIRLSHLTVCFKGENPLFYSGHEFLAALANLFKVIGMSENSSEFRYLNLSELQVDFDVSFIKTISSNCQNLQYLNILNNMLVCNVSWPSIRYLATKCQNLQVLHLLHASLSDEVLDALSEPHRAPLKRLGVVCRRQDKYVEDLSSEAWSKLLSFNPDLQVELGFDHTCPLHIVAKIMKPEIPIIELHLGTFTIIDPEIRIATSFYGETLEKLVVHTRPCKELDDALLSLAKRCKKLRSLIVYCTVDQEVIDEILHLHPVMKRKGSYILKSEEEPEPWTVGKEEGD